mmetsp:Transcript_30287/g.41672  ORF Transcript_30287/g.41672 Transcript_30287/m.41672 type:complete len:382 (+) Transcript_30287:32-1177(+)
MIEAIKLLLALNYAILTFSQNYSTEHFQKMVESQTGFVLDAWKVQHAWVNPSMALSPSEPNKIIMVWRMPDKGRHDKMGYMWLNFSTWEVIKKKDMIEIINPNKWRTNLVGEDPRIFYHNGKEYIVYNHHLSRFKKLFYAELFYNKPEDMFYTIDPPNHVAFENEVNIRHQKNWIPFDFCPSCNFQRGLTVANSNATLLFIYSIRPHRIVQAFATNVSGEMRAETIFLTELLPEFRWRWGEMRGGSPALLMGDFYLSFFHSSGHLSHKHIGTYVMGAYTFERNPPFAITRMSAEPIFHESFINETYGWAYKGVDFIVFPMGFTFDDDFIYVSYGKNDRDGWILKLNRSGLMESLKPVQSKILGVSDWEDSNITRHSFRQLV